MPQPCRPALLGRLWERIPLPFLDALLWWRVLLRGGPRGWPTFGRLQVLGRLGDQLQNLLIVGTRGRGDSEGQGPFIDRIDQQMEFVSEPFRNRLPGLPLLVLVFPSLYPPGGLWIRRLRGVACPSGMSVQLGAVDPQMVTEAWQTGSEL